MLSIMHCGKFFEEKQYFCLPLCMVTRDLENPHYVVYHALWHAIYKKLCLVAVIYGKTGFGKLTECALSCF